MARLSAKSTVAILYAACLFANTRAAYESAGCSDQGCGIPCYMRPASDNCHYKPHSPCSNEGHDLDLENLILNLNTSLHRLTNKLVQKRAISAGETCEPLDPITNGGVVYSDLLLSPGVVAHYVCQNGYVLHGHDERECAPDGGWINSEKGTPVCRDSLVQCESLVPIPRGHIHYESVDRTTIRPGDMVTYSCDALYILEGESYRVCISNGSWSGEEPSCNLRDLEPTLSATTSGGSKVTHAQSNTATQDSNHNGKVNVALIAGASAGGAGGLLAIVIIISIVLYVYRKHKKNKKGSQKRYDPLQMRAKLIDDTDASTLKTALLEEDSSTSVKMKPLSKTGRSEKIETLQAEYSL